MVPMRSTPSNELATNETNLCTAVSGETHEHKAVRNIPGGLRSLLLRELIYVLLRTWIAHVHSHLEQMPEFIELPKLPLRIGCILAMANARWRFDKILRQCQYMVHSLKSGMLT